MMDQLSFAPLDLKGTKKWAKRYVFLAEMAAIAPWIELEALIEPHFLKTRPQGGYRSFPLSTMLRIYCLQHWYSLSDPGVVEALYNTQSIGTLAALESGRDTMADETTIFHSRHPLERHELTKGVLAAVAKPGRALTKRQLARNYPFCRGRTKAKHVFGLLECQFDYPKVRYRDIAKNGAQVFSLIALANPCLVRRRLAAT